MKRFLPLFLSVFMLISCSDDATSMFSNREYVFCRLPVTSYPELLSVMGNPGQFASIRKRGTMLTITSNGSSTDYDLRTNAIYSTFEFGLGGIIVGTSYLTDENGRFIDFCYDLACPICDSAGRKLTLSNDGYAKCAKCGVVYDLNNYGVIHKVPENADLTVKRGLYRYRINYNGQIVNAYN